MSSGRGRVCIKKYWCDICGLLFTRSTSVARHKQSVHDKVRYQCPLCTQSFTQKSHLGMHIRNIHHDFLQKSGGAEAGTEMVTGTTTATASAAAVTTATTTVTATPKAAVSATATGNGNKNNISDKSSDFVVG